MGRRCERYRLAVDSGGYCGLDAAVPVDGGDGNGRYLMSDNYYERCYLTWIMDARHARQREIWDSCNAVHKPNNRFIWYPVKGGWCLFGELPTI